MKNIGFIFIISILFITPYSSYPQRNDTKVIQKNITNEVDIIANKKRDSIEALIHKELLQTKKIVNKTIKLKDDSIRLDKLEKIEKKKVLMETSKKVEPVDSVTREVILPASLEQVNEIISKNPEIVKDSICKQSRNTFLFFGNKCVKWSYFIRVK